MAKNDVLLIVPGTDPAEVRTALDRMAGTRRRLTTLIPDSTKSIDEQFRAGLAAAARRPADALVVASTHCDDACVESVLGTLQRSKADAAYEATGPDAMSHTHVPLTMLHPGCVAFRVAAMRDAETLALQPGHVSLLSTALVTLHQAGHRVIASDRWCPYAPRFPVTLRDTASLQLLSWRARLAARGFATQRHDAVYAVKEAADSSHTAIHRWLRDRSGAKILDLGCSNGAFAAQLRALGHSVIGVDLHQSEGVEERCDTFIRADLDAGMPPEVIKRGPYEAVICADVLEHTRAPEVLLQQIPSLLAPGGSLLVSVPNFGHWYARGRTALGLFDYDQRGILDAGHLRFFTRRSFERLLRSTGWSLKRRDITGLPLERLTAASASLAARTLKSLDVAACRLRPTLFAYQFLYELTPADADVTIEAREAAA